MKRRLCLISLALLILISACIAVPAGSTLVPASPLPPPTATITQTAAPTPSPSPSAAPTELPHPPITRVVIISIDGLRPDEISLAPMPVLQGLMQAGAYSLSAQTISPSTTLPAHASMLTGLCPSAHGVDWDQYEPERGIALGTDLFDLAHAAGMRTILLVGKEKLKQVTDAASLDISQWVNDPDEVIGQRAAVLIPQGFSVLFVHFPDNDVEGHAYGWMSLDQLLAVRKTDRALQMILDALDSAKMRENTLIIVTADHGGHNTSHGFDIPADMTIPWIANGPGIKSGPLTIPINTTDTAATAAWALGLPLPAEWSGIPIYQAFGLPDTGPRADPRCP